MEERASVTTQRLAPPGHLVLLVAGSHDEATEHREHLGVGACTREVVLGAGRNQHGVTGLHVVELVADLNGPAARDHVEELVSSSVAVQAALLALRVYSSADTDEVTPGEVREVCLLGELRVASDTLHGESTLAHTDAHDRIDTTL